MTHEKDLTVLLQLLIHQLNAPQHLQNTVRSYLSKNSSLN